MKVDVVASEPHYLRHLAPIWAALPDRLRGDIRPLYEPGGVIRPPFARVALVAGWQDVAPLRNQCQMIYVEHGAGQMYVDREHDPSYSGSGGERHRGVIGYIAPSETVARRWRTAPAVAVGCPKMDAWHHPDRIRPVDLDQPTVCLAWHWECTLVPETRSAWLHYADALPAIIERWWQQGWRVALHFHPKWRGRMDHVAAEMGADLFTSEEHVFRQADVLVIDNSSLGYEFASLGRPVLAVNAPWYRRDVEHGLRFWQFPPGPQIDDPEALAAVNLWDLVGETPLGKMARLVGDAAVAHAYHAVDGKASQRAAAFIEQLLDGE